MKGAKTNPPKRGRAAPDRQLSELQRKVLIFLLSCDKATRDLAEEMVQLFSSEAQRERKVIRGALAKTRQKGQPWSAKHFYLEAPTKAQEATLSKALHRLEARGLVSLYDAAGGLGRKGRTTHVKLTSPGKRAAAYLADNNGMSEREALQKQRKDELRARLNELYAERDDWYEKVLERGRQPNQPQKDTFAFPEEGIEAYDMYDWYSDESLVYIDNLDYAIAETAQKLREAPILREYPEG